MAPAMLVEVKGVVQEVVGCLLSHSATLSRKTFGKMNILMTNKNKALCFTQILEPK